VFDSGGSSGQLRDELGVLPPGDVLKCALALARSEAEAREILLARLPMLEHQRLAGHTGGNLLLSMMEQYTGDFLAAVDALQTLLGCQGHVWPITIERSTLCARYSDGSTTRGEFEVDAGQARGGSVERLWLDPPVSIHRTVAETIRSLDAVVIGPGSFYTSLLPIFLVEGCREALAAVRGPVIYIANLLTEGRGWVDSRRTRRRAILPRPSDALWIPCSSMSSLPMARCSNSVREDSAATRADAGCYVIEGAFWRPDAPRPLALRAAVWVIGGKLLLRG
jgi:uncharacterized cofD-like protein